jgi:hypothetical protein
LHQVSKTEAKNVFANVAVAKTVIDKSQFIEFMVKIALLIEPHSVAPLLPERQSVLDRESTSILPSPEVALMNTTSALARVLSATSLAVSTSTRPCSFDTPQAKLLALTTLLRLDEPKFVR